MIGPGPGSPSDHTHLVRTIPLLEKTIPILGICLGHQMIVEAYNGKVIPTGTPMHGKSSEIFITRLSCLFRDIPSPFIAARYHSLAAFSISLPLEVTAYAMHHSNTNQHIIMAVEHTSAPIYGIQFHPESFLSEHGLTLLQNFLNISIDQDNQTKTIS